MHASWTTRSISSVVTPGRTMRAPTSSTSLPSYRQAGRRRVNHTSLMSPHSPDMPLGGPLSQEETTAGSLRLSLPPSHCEEYLQHNSERRSHRESTSLTFLYTSLTRLWSANTLHANNENLLTASQSRECLGLQERNQARFIE